MNETVTRADPNDTPGVARTERRPSGRPRSEAARRAVLDAAYEVLSDGGIATFSIDAVAKSSGVARTTIYRWWSSKSVLAIESFLDRFQPQVTVPRTDNPEEDFCSLVVSLTVALAGPAGRVAASVIAHAQSDTVTQQLFRDQFSEPLRRESTLLLQAGIAQGQFREDLEVGRVIDALVGAVYLRLLLGSPLSVNWATDLGRALLIGCHKPS